MPYKRFTKKDAEDLNLPSDDPIILSTFMRKR